MITDCKLNTSLHIEKFSTLFFVRLHKIKNVKRLIVTINHLIIDIIVSPFELIQSIIF